MTESEAIKEVRFNMSRIGLNNKSAKRVSEAKNIAIQALEKQIPEKPVNYDKHYYKCPCCNEDLEIDDDMLFVYDEEPPKFCPKCGQKLDWSDEE